MKDFFSETIVYQFWHLVCKFERTHYDGNTALDNTMNSVINGVDRATCEAWCNGDTAYTPNPRYNSTSTTKDSTSTTTSNNKNNNNGSECEYMKWLNLDGGVCSLYQSFEQAHAWHRCSPGNLYRRKCEVVAVWNLWNGPCLRLLSDYD